MNRGAIQKYARYGAVAILAGLLVAWSGVIPIAASSGHWPITAWFLHFVMRRSVQTHAMGIEVPPLDDPDLALRGAGHYHTGCAPCHGAPGLPRSRIVLEMTPQPPYLPTHLHSWNPEDLFWIVKHGVKYTGMPAWVARGRDDEVWSVVAFLLALPALTPADYQRLARGEARPAANPHMADPADAALRRLIDDCARCHGYDGLGRGGAFPKLPHLSPEYVYAALRSYADNARTSGIMQPVAVALDDAGMQALADYYTRQTADPAPPSGASPAELAHGREIAERGLPKQGVPPCAHCHGPDAVADNPFFPSLDGQYRSYLVTQLHLWRRGQRGGTAYAPVMTAVARELEPAQIEAVAAYYASLESSSRRARPTAPTPAGVPAGPAGP